MKIVLVSEYPNDISGCMKIDSNGNQGSGMDWGSNKEIRRPTKPGLSALCNQYQYINISMIYLIDSNRYQGSDMFEQ